jgi:hypothetical protein
MEPICGLNVDESSSNRKDQTLEMECNCVITLYSLGWGSNSHAGSSGPKNSGSLHKAICHPAIDVYKTRRSRDHKRDQSCSAWLWAAERRPATLLALLAPDLISIGGISRPSLVPQANKPKIVHGVHV